MIGQKNCLRRWLDTRVTTNTIWEISKCPHVVALVAYTSGVAKGTIRIIFKYSFHLYTGVVAGS